MRAKTMARLQCSLTSMPAIRPTRTLAPTSRMLEGRLNWPGYTFASAGARPARARHGAAVGEWQTRQFQERVAARTWGVHSSPPHQPREPRTHRPKQAAALNSLFALGRGDNA